MRLLLILLVPVLLAVTAAVLVRASRRGRDDGRLRVRDLPFPPDSTARQALDDAYSRGEMSREHYEDRVRRLGDHS